MFKMFCFGDENILFTLCSIGMQLNEFNTCLNFMQTFGMRTSKLHLNWAAMDKPWSPNNHERAPPFICHSSDLISGVPGGIEGYVECFQWLV